jgi:hypothetical protein
VLLCVTTRYWNFHTHTVHLDIIKVFYSPTDAQVNCLKNNFKIYIKIDIDDGDCTETCRCCFNVNYNLKFKIVIKDNSLVHQLVNGKL